MTKPRPFNVTVKSYVITYDDDGWELVYPNGRLVPETVAARRKWSSRNYARLKANESALFYQSLGHDAVALHTATRGRHE